MKRVLASRLAWLAAFILAPLAFWFAAWAVAIGSLDRPKSLANVVEEPFVVACLGVVLFIAQWLTNRRDVRVRPLVLLSVGCAIGVAIALVVPSLPE